MPKKTKHKIILWTMVAAMIGIDHLTKWLTTTNLELQETFPFIENIFHFTYHRNPGAAHGMLADHRWVFMSLSTVAIVVLLVMIVFFYDRFSTLANFGAAAILAGGIGNMIDRVFFGETLFGGSVIDMLDVRAFGGIWGPIFNFADIFITLGVVVFMYAFIRDEIRLAKASKAEALADGMAESTENIDQNIIENEADSKDSLPSDDTSVDTEQQPSTESEETIEPEELKESEDTQETNEAHN